MPRLTRDSNIKVGNKEYKVEDLLKTIIYLPETDIKNYFMDLGLTIPRELRMYVLKENLREKVVETRKSRLTMADEINYRLSWFTEFCETQLENLLVFFDDERIFRNYLEDFWTDLLGYMVEKHVPAEDMKRLYDLSVQQVKKHGLVLPNLKTYNRGLKDIFYDSFGRIDGLAPQKLRPVLYKSSTLGEIRDLGTKYGVNVPRRLKKNELAEIIINELKDEGKYTEELERKIKGMSVIVMQRYAVDHDIKASTELKKEEIIEYVLKHAEETKETYFVPQSIEEYDKEVHDVSEDVVKEEPAKIEAVEEEPKAVVVETVEEVKEELVVEVKEEAEDIVVEEPVIEQEVEKVETKVETNEKPQIQYVGQSINLDELVKEIKLLREAIEKNREEKKVEVVKEVTEKEPIIQPENVVQDEIEIETLEDAQTMEVSQQEALILNSAEFYGDKKLYKKLQKKEEAAEREAFIEKQKENSTIGVDQNDDEKLPAEVRFFGKLFKRIGKILFKIIIIVVPIALILLLLFGLLTYYVTTLTFLDGIKAALNNLVYIGGRGLIDFIHHLFASIGM
ncbi:hypothetical protein BK011_04100 [Tenericutes bacterium MZ-XQ]|jgi:hypothetical protein|nr:hypothetical protein BK011_04100 [Tenericutes bacterium MZ-XQ]